MRRTVRIAGAAFGIVLLVALALPFLIDANQFRPLIESKLTTSLHRDVKLGNLKLALLQGGVTASDLSIEEDPAFGREPFAKARALKVEVELLPLILSRQLKVKGLTIEGPDVRLVQATSGKWNFSSLGADQTATPVAKAAAFDLTVNRVRISDGRFSLGRLGSTATPQVLEKLNLELHDFSAQSAFPFRLTAKPSGGGDLKLEGNAGPVDSVDAARTPFEGKFTATDVDLLASGLADVAGIVSLDGNVTSTGRVLKTRGKLKGQKLRLAKGGKTAGRGVELEWAIDHDTRAQGGSLSHGEIHIGKAVAHLTGVYSLQGPAPVIHMKLAGNAMPLPEFVAMLPALDIVMPAGSTVEGGTAKLDLTLDGPANALVLRGPLSIEKTVLKGFDLGAKVSTVQRLAGIKAGKDTEIQLLSAMVTDGPEGTSVDDIRFIAPAVGHMTGAGTISPEHALDFKLRLTLHTSGALMAAIGQKGDTTIPLLVQGTSSDPVFKPNVKDIVHEKIKSLTGGKPAKEAATGFLKGLLKSKN